METARMRECVCCMSSNWRCISCIGRSKGALVSSVVMFATLVNALAETTIATSTNISLPISKESLNVNTSEPNLPSTPQSVPLTASLIGPTYMPTPPPSNVPSDSSTDSTYTFFETLLLNSTNNISSTSPPSEFSTSTSQKQTTNSSGKESASTQSTTLISEQTKISGEVTWTGDPSRAYISTKLNDLKTTEKVAPLLEMADEQVEAEFSRRTADAVTQSNTSVSSELPKIHFTLFTDWWHATILLGIEVFFYIITLGIIYFMRRNNIRWPQVMQDDSDSQSDTEAFG